MRYRSTKTYGHNIGLSAAFRQWRAQSHCSRLHGYALSVRFEFGTNTLDGNNWVVDFGGLKSLKSFLERWFDHKTLVAEDDPDMDWFQEAHRRQIIDLVVLPHTGCEKFAQHIFTFTEQWLHEQGLSPRCELLSVEVREHGANSAIVYKE